VSLFYSGAKPTATGIYYLHPGLLDLRLASYSPQPVAERGRLGEFFEIQYGTQRLIILNVANLIYF